MDLNLFKRAIATIESGQKYDKLGPVTRSGDRALGKYQVMGANVGPWTEAALGERLTPQEFLNNPKAQEAVFEHRFGSYVQKYGPEGAARAWFAGEKGMHNSAARDQLGTSVGNYGQRFTQLVGQGGGETRTVPTLGGETKLPVGKTPKSTVPGAPVITGQEPFNITAQQKALEDGKRVQDPGLASTASPAQRPQMAGFDRMAQNLSQTDPGPGGQPDFATDVLNRLALRIAPGTKAQVDPNAPPPVSQQSPTYQRWAQHKGRDPSQTDPSHISTPFSQHKGAQPQAQEPFNINAQPGAEQPASADFGLANHDIDDAQPVAGVPMQGFGDDPARAPQIEDPATAHGIMAPQMQPGLAEAGVPGPGVEMPRAVPTVHLRTPQATQLPGQGVDPALGLPAGTGGQLPAGATPTSGASPVPMPQPRPSDAGAGNPQAALAQAIQSVFPEMGSQHLGSYAPDDVLGRQRSMQVQGPQPGGPQPIMAPQQAGPLDALMKMLGGGGASGAPASQQAPGGPMAATAAPMAPGAPAPAGGPFGATAQPAAPPQQGAWWSDPGVRATGMPGVTSGFMARLTGPGPGIRAQTMRAALDEETRVRQSQQMNAAVKAYQRNLVLTGDPKEAWRRTMGDSVMDPAILQQLPQLQQMIGGIPMKQQTSGLTNALKAAFPSEPPEALQAMVDGAVQAGISVDKIPEFVQTQIAERNRQKAFSEVMGGQNIPMQPGQMQQTESGEPAPYRPGHGLRHPDAYRKTGLKLHSLGMTEAGNSMYAIARDLDKAKEFDAGAVQDREEAKYTGQRAARDKQRFPGHSGALIGLNSETPWTFKDAEDAGINVEILADPKAASDVRKAKLQDIRMIQSGRELADLVQNRPELIGVTGRLVRAVNGLTEQMVGLGVGTAQMFGVDPTSLLNRPEIKKILQSELATESAIVQSRVLDFAYALATSYKSERLNESDMRRAFGSIGTADNLASSQQLSHTVRDITERIRLGAIRDFEAVAGIPPLDLLYKSELQQMIIQHKDNPAMLRALDDQITRRERAARPNARP